MRVNGLNVVAILVAAVAMYAIGAIWYGFAFSDLWMRLSGFSKDDFAGEEWRMALSPVMPLLICTGLAVAAKWRGVSSWKGGACTGFWMALFFVFASRLYAFTYGTEPPALLALDGAHLFLGCLVSGAIIGAWK